MIKNVAVRFFENIKSNIALRDSFWNIGIDMNTDNIRGIMNEFMLACKMVPPTINKILNNIGTIKIKYKKVQKLIPKKEGNDLRIFNIEYAETDKNAYNGVNTVINSKNRTVPNKNTTFSPYLFSDLLPSSIILIIRLVKEKYNCRRNLPVE